MLKFPIWKSVTLFIVCLLGVYFALPTIFYNSDFVGKSSLLPHNKINLGLDLRGGSYLLIEVDVDAYKQEQLQSYGKQLKKHFRVNKVKFSQFHNTDQGFAFQIQDVGKSSSLKEIVHEVLGKPAQLNIQGNHATIHVPGEVLTGIEDNLIVQSMEIIRRRLDESGTREVDIQRHGANYILVQVPGLDDPKEIKELLGKTARLSLHLVYDGDDAARREALFPPPGYKAVRMDMGAASAKNFIFVTVAPIITGEMLVDAQATINMNSPVVSFKLNNLGSRIFADVTAKNSGRLLAILLDETVISAPAIREAIPSGTGVISGSFSMKEATELAMLLRAGALPAPLKIVEERTIGPSLGIDSIEAGIKAICIGVAAVFMIMAVYYRFFGLIANIALLFNLVFLISALSILGATLTLPGLAGVVLTLGMAVDANVLIFERIKEELRGGRSIAGSIDTGYQLAFTTILDSNITTLIAAVLLYTFGSGPIKGFAITLSIGILCSMFTAITLTKYIIIKWYRIRRPETLNI